jgi:hypothetical protein
MIALPRIVTDSSGTYMLDPIRNKMLSIARYQFFAGRYSQNVTLEYLRFDDGIPGTSSGRVIRNNATIVSLGGMTSDVSSWYLKIFKYGSNSPILSQQIGTKSFTFNSLNIDVNAGDILQFFVDGTNIKMPLVELELAWRL